MDRATVDIYDARGAEWTANHPPVEVDRARAFAARVRASAVRIDLGCGAGRYSADLGAPIIGLDASRPMLEAGRDAVPGMPVVQGDLEALPFGTGTLHGGWAHMSYLHVRRVHLPGALADLHRALVLGAPVTLQVLAGDYEGHALDADTIGGRFFAGWTPQRLDDVLVGAGFDVEDIAVDRDVVRARAVRARTLPDVVGPGMRLLVVGLNPSVYSADVGVGYGRPGNRFWPAARRAGLVTRDRDPRHALRVHGVGMTDIVKRATPKAATLTALEYRDGMARVDRLVQWLAPGAVCFVGLSGWRVAVDRAAVAGRQATRIGGRPVYVMPSTSGANAHAQLDALSAHFGEAASLSAEV